MEGQSCFRKKIIMGACKNGKTYKNYKQFMWEVMGIFFSKSNRGATESSKLSQVTGCLSVQVEDLFPGIVWSNHLPSSLTTRVYPLKGKHREEMCVCVCVKRKMHAEIMYKLNEGLAKLQEQLLAESETIS